MRKLTDDRHLPPPILAILETVSLEEMVFPRLRRGELKPEQLPLNALDAHPLKYLNQIFAQRIGEIIVPLAEATLVSRFPGRGGRIPITAVFRGGYVFIGFLLMLFDTFRLTLFRVLFSQDRVRIWRSG